MELIQTRVYNREGKKWKQRWAILKKYSPNNSQSTSRDLLYYLFLYKDGVHAKEGKEKQALSLGEFCGLDSIKEYDKANNVLVIITKSQTAFLSFDNIELRDKWSCLLIEIYGEAFTYNISIPDKQKLKSGQGTLRLYPNFFSIINSKNFRCLNRWFSNDLLRYVAASKNQFMFEIGPPNKQKGMLVNIEVQDTAELLKRFSEYEDLVQPISSRDFHGSSLLDDLTQAKRNARDNNFIRRTILRASDRMRKRIRERTRTAPSNSLKKPGTSSFKDSISEEKKFYSIDRKTSPDIGVQSNDETNERTQEIIRNISQLNSPPSRPFTKHISIDEPPQLPIKKSPNPSSSSQPVGMTSDIVRAPEQPLEEKPLAFKPRSMTTSDIPVINKDLQTVAPSKRCTSRSEEQIVYTNIDLDTLMRYEKNRTNEHASIVTPERAPIKPAPANPAKYVLSKSKRPSRNKGDKTPTPPPRSPVSLGLTTNQQPDQQYIFDFSTEAQNQAAQQQQQHQRRTSHSLLSEIDNEVKRRTINSEDLSDDAFTYSSEPSPASSYTTAFTIPRRSNHIQRHESGNSKDSSDDSLPVRDPRRWRASSAKHLSDPLCLEAWTAATGDGPNIINMPDKVVDKVDYVNIKGTQNTRNDDGDNDSYVNVSSGSGKPELCLPLGKRKKNVPRPLKLKNGFEKYDDDDASIYHPVGAIDSNDGGSSSSTSCIGPYRKGGSHENMNIKPFSSAMIQNKHSDYLNLMSHTPSANFKDQLVSSSELNYVQVVGGGKFHSKSVSTSPLSLVPRSPSEMYKKSDYTVIDDGRTAALNKSMVERRLKQQAQSGSRTPTSKTPK